MQITSNKPINFKSSISKKANRDYGTKFNISETQDTQSIALNTMPLVNYNFMFEQEKSLLECSREIIRFLESILLKLLNQEFDLKNLETLTEFLEMHKSKFLNDETDNLYKEIILRANIEIAKLEKLFKN